MDKTGIGLLEILSLVAILLPLIPVFIIFIYRSYRQDALALLMVFCLVSFMQNVILYIPKVASVDMLFIRATFQLLQFVILLILLEMVITGKWLQEGIKVLLISFVSVVITIYCLQGIQQYMRIIELMQAILLISTTLVTLSQLIKSHDIHIFLSPLFWIACGTLFYYSMFFITQSIPEYTTVLHGEPQQQKKVLLLIILLIQFIFYIVAATIARTKNNNDQLIMH